MAGAFAQEDLTPHGKIPYPGRAPATVRDELLVEHAINRQLGVGRGAIRERQVGSPKVAAAARTQGGHLQDLEHPQVQAKAVQGQHLGVRCEHGQAHGHGPNRPGEDPQHQDGNQRPSPHLFPVAGGSTS